MEIFFYFKSLLYKTMMKREKKMIKHYITKYEEDGKLYAESWIQINIFGRCYCISRKRLEIKAAHKER